MVMDQCNHRYASWEELQKYCYRVASVVEIDLSAYLGNDR